MTQAQDYDALVVGAGPAGSAAATILAERGRRVLLIEKDRFPRAKVCGEFLSASARESLVRLGALALVESGTERIERGSVHLPRGRPVAFDLPAPGIGISRARLDDLLARNAQARGAQARFGTRVLSVDRGPDSTLLVRCAAAGSSPAQVRARGVIGAWGRWDALDRTLGRGFADGRARYFGWSRDYRGAANRLAGAVHLYLFPGGYCGLSRVEGGAVNLAGVIAERDRSRLCPGWPAVIAHARASNADLDRDLADLSEGPDGFLGTGPVFFTAKPPVEGAALMAGDAAGVIDPFSGEGQATALASGILAAEILERGLSGRIPIEAVPREYARDWSRRFGRRFDWSATFRRLMLHPAAGRLVGPLCGERLIRFAIARLTSPGRLRA